MRPVTVAAALALLLVLGGVAAIGVLGPPGIDDGSVSLEARWISDTAQDGEVNHHSPAAGVVDGQPVVYAPVSAGTDAGTCALVALNATAGGELWRYPLPQVNCTVHSVADPGIADYDDDGTAEVLAATTENAVHAFGALSGEREFRHDLAGYGYTRPIATDLVGDGSSEVVVVDVRGTVFVLRPDGTTEWTHAFDAYVWANPAVGDLDADGEPEVAVGMGGGTLVALDRDGSPEWNRSEPFQGSITWMAAGQADEDPAMEIVAATADGEVVALDGASGEVEWSRDFGAYAAVAEVADGTGDGDVEVYAVARDGRLRALDAATGETRWTTTLTTADVQMMPAPRLGDLDGDGAPEIVAVSYDGVVSVVDPVSGEITDSYRRDVAILTDPAVADVDGDGADEVFVMYGDGRVVALSGGSSD